jgi:hypothetical protein
MQDGEGDVGTEDYAGGEHGDESMFAEEDPGAEGAGDDANGGDSMFTEEEPSVGKGDEGSAPAASKSKFRRVQQKAGARQSSGHD